MWFIKFKIKGEIAHFFTDIYGDTKIYVKWKPEAIKPNEVTLKNFKKNSKYFMIDPHRNEPELNVIAILDDFKIIGHELVQSLTVKNNSSIFK